MIRARSSHDNENNARRLDQPRRRFSLFPVLFLFPSFLACNGQRLDEASASEPSAITVDRARSETKRGRERSAAAAAAMCNTVYPPPHSVRIRRLDFRSLETARSSLSYTRRTVIPD